MKPEKTSLRTPASSLPEPEALMELGVIGRAHGLKGEVSLHYYAESLEWLQGPLWLRSGNTGTLRPVRTESFRMHNGQVLALFEGVADRTAAETLRGVTLLMPESALPVSDEETLYVHDLLGLDVVEHATGEPVGVLAHVDFTGGQELWSIESADGREILLPAVPEFVDSVDFDRGVIRIMPPPGLLELYA
jgi:16S rRNA processing protein RimM